MFSTDLRESVPEVARGSRPNDLWHLWARICGKRLRPPSLQRPVISVGNLSFGGRGKTPTVAHLAGLLLQAGERPAILTRGYARRDVEDGVVIVSDGLHLQADVERSGDEPLMLARELPGVAVLVCDQRALAGALAERALGATVHVLDDGFQHTQLARDVDLVIVAPADLRDRPLPFGRLREPVGALAAADAVIVDDGETDLPPSSALAPNGQPVFTLRRALGDPIPLESDRSTPDRSAPVAAVAGIAAPERFLRGLEAAGWRVTTSHTFRDHHSYSGRDVKEIAAAAARAGASTILTTAKDAMRLLPLRPFPMPIAYVPLTVTIEPAAAFRTWFFDRLARRHA